jgi:hypothetical protein
LPYALSSREIFVCGRVVQLQLRFYSNVSLILEIKAEELPDIVTGLTVDCSHKCPRKATQCSSRSMVRFTEPEGPSQAKLSDTDESDSDGTMGSTALSSHTLVELVF